MSKRNLISGCILFIILITGSFFLKDRFSNLYAAIINEIPIAVPTKTAPSLSVEIPDNLRDYFALRDKLENKQFQDLEEHFSKLIALLENDISIEQAVNGSVSTLANGNPEYEALLNQWVDQYPDSAAAYLVRGNYFNDVGYLYRGTEFYRELSEKQIEKWQSYSSKANEDLAKSLQLNPNISVTYADIINNSGGTKQERAKLIAEALDARPESYSIRLVALNMSRPRWGGSMDAIEALVEDTKKYISKNPQLKALLGYVDFEVASEHYLKKEYYQAKQAYAKALSYGEETSYLTSRAYLYYNVDEMDKAVRDLNRIIYIAPGSADTQKLLGRYYLKQKNYEEALKHFALAAKLRPYDYDIQYIYGWTLDHFKQFKAAEKAYKKALHYAISRGSKAWMSLGNLYSDKIKDKNKAKYTYVMAVMTNAESPINWFNYSLFLGNNKDCDVMGAAYMHSKICELSGNKRDKHCAPKYLDRNNGIITSLPKEGMCPSIDEYIKNGSHPLKIYEKIQVAEFLRN